ncbi:hypothetical protein [Streptomyces chartreusis]
MPIAFGSATTTTLNAGGNNAATVAVNVPASTADGDMLLLLVGVSESAGVSPTVSGSWTQKATIDQVTSGDNQDNTLRLFWRRASSEPASYTVTPDGTYGNYVAVAMLRYTGVIRTGDPFRTSATGTGGATLGSPKTSVSLSGVQSTDMAIHFTGAAKSSWNTDAYDLAGPGGGWTERGEVYMTVASTGKPGILCLEQLGTGTAPTYTATGTGAGNVTWCFIAGALMEEPAPPLKNQLVFTTAVRRASTW